MRSDAKLLTSGQAVRRPSARRGPGRTRAADRPTTSVRVRPVQSGSRRARLRLLLFPAAAAAALLSQTLSADAVAPSAHSYVIKPGDTLVAIAAAVGSTVGDLVKANGITDPNLIIAGHRLTLPDGLAGPASSPAAGSTSSATGPASGSGSAPGVVYTVAQGDTLWTIAQAANVTVDQIQTANNLSDPSVLQVGQKLLIPNPTAAGGGQATAGGGQTAAAIQPAAPVAAASLANKLVGAAANVPGSGNVHYGFAALNLATGQQVVFHSGDVFPSASVMKLPILVEYERQLAAGKLANASTLRPLVAAMVDESDNSAANKLMDVLGIGNVNSTMASLGLTATHLVNHFDDPSAPQHAGENSTTPSDMVHLLALIAQDKVVSPQACADMRSLLLGNTDQSKLVRLLPAGTAVAHKSGWYPGVAADVGIVTPSGSTSRWVVAMFTDGIPSAETGNQMIAAVSQALYTAWAGAGH